MFDQVLKNIHKPQAAPPSRQASSIRANQFMEKVQKLGLEVEELGEQQGGEAQQGNPMILSGEHFHHQPTVDKIKLLRIRNKISQLKQLHWDLSDSIDEQRNITEVQQEGIAHQIIDFFLAQKRAAISTKSTRMCTECEATKEREAIVRKALQDLQAEHQSLLGENEQLQEHIFDIEQKIVGVDLEVERKINEYSKGNSRIQDPQSQNGPSQTQQQQQKMVSHLNEEIGQLQEQILRYEKMVLDEEELNQRMRRVDALEKEWSEREAALRDAVVSIQKQKDTNYQRQHQILTAQENLSVKIAEIRKKESQLSQWEAQLARKAALNRREAPSKQIHSNEDFYLNNDKQQSVNSFGRHSYNQHIMESPAFVAASGDPEPFPPRPTRPPSNPNYNINILPSSEAKYEKQVADRQSSQKFTSSAYAPLRQTQTRKYVDTASRYKESKELSPYRANDAIRRNQNQRSSNSRYNSPSNNFRQLSKHSRHSANKSIRSNQPLGLHESRGREQIGGLGSKLERLREEIKREIDSIK